MRPRPLASCWDSPTYDPEQLLELGEGRCWSEGPVTHRRRVYTPAEAIFASGSTQEELGARG